MGLRIICLGLMLGLTAACGSEAPSPATRRTTVQLPASAKSGAGYESQAKSASEVKSTPDVSVSTLPVPPAVEADQGQDPIIANQKSGEVVEQEEELEVDPSNSAPSIEDGIYTLSSMGGKKCMDIADGMKMAGVNLQLWDCTGSEFQQFRIESTEDGFYKISNIASGFSLQIRDAKADDGAIVEQGEYSGLATQKFSFEMKEDNSGFYVKASSAELSITPKDGASANKSMLDLATHSQSASWVLQKID